MQTLAPTIVTIHSKPNLPEGVRMTVTPNVGAETQETAILSPPVDIQRAITVTQNAPLHPLSKSKSTDHSTTSKMFATIASNHLKAMSAIQGIEAKSPEGPQSPNHIAPLASSTGSSSTGSDKKNLLAATTLSPTSATTNKFLGRKKTVIECSAGTSSSSTGTDDNRSKNLQGGKTFKRTDKIYGSPDSPLSKMSVMPNPYDETDASGLPAPKKIATLEFPTPERLLPIGPQESIASLVDRVRDGLNLPDISHLKQDSLDISESTTKDELSPSSRATSPRRLIKQVALESPPNSSIPDARNDLHTSILKAVSHDTNKGSGVSSKATRPSLAGSSKSGRSNKTSRDERARQKKVPFPIDCNPPRDMQLPKYAGYWPPPNQQDDNGVPNPNIGSGGGYRLVS